MYALESNEYRYTTRRCCPHTSDPSPIAWSFEVSDTLHPLDCAFLTHRIDLHHNRPFRITRRSCCPFHHFRPSSCSSLGCVFCNHLQRNSLWMLEVWFSVQSQLCPGFHSIKQQLRARNCGMSDVIFDWMELILIGRNGCIWCRQSTSFGEYSRSADRGASFGCSCLCHEVCEEKIGVEGLKDQCSVFCITVSRMQLAPFT